MQVRSPTKSMTVSSKAVSLLFMCVVLNLGDVQHTHASNLSTNHDSTSNKPSDEPHQYRKSARIIAFAEPSPPNDSSVDARSEPLFPESLPSRHKQDNALRNRLTKSDVQHTVRQNHYLIRECDQNHNSKGISGTVNVAFTILPSGRVSNISLHYTSSKYRGTDAAGCILDAVQSMTFPRSKTEKRIKKYPFILLPRKN